ncbi:DUF1365 domain-containing protein [Hyphococcus lacteus]|uniref:DUF1365 domain-containing protein n=1 Tax=Hyphococcus lacteus TaxID=3143536 RepID=A0ABV3Z4Z6_9PROT
MTFGHFYKGSVFHARLTAPLHKFRYKIAYICVDLDEIARAPAISKLFGWRKRRPISIDPKNYGDGQTGNLAGWVREMLSGQGITTPATRIELLTIPKIFGYVFNPISIYYIYDGEKLHHLIYEVNNTFGGRHHYFAATKPDGGVQFHRCTKALYVSPYFDVKGYYEFEIIPPRDKISLDIDYFDDHDTLAMKASFSGKKLPITDRQCLKILLAFPFMTVGVVVAIHWEALKLFLKGARLKPANGTDRSLGGLTREDKKITPRHIEIQ